MKTVSEKKFTRARKKDTEEKVHKSALSDHVVQTNHLIAWDKVTLPMKEANWKIRGIKEAIRKAGPNALNRDGGRHHLPNKKTSMCKWSLIKVIEWRCDLLHILADTE